MLYVSRRVWSCITEGRTNGPLVEERFGLVDTETGIETVVSRNHIEMCVRQRTLDIKGVEVFGAQRIVTDIEPYQPIESCTRAQAKLNVLNHVSLKTYKGSITSIIWRVNELKEPVTIRLSDFGKSCSDCILWGNLGSKHSVTLVLDDKITISDDTFRPESENVSVIFDGGLGVVFDLRELTVDETAAKVYASVVRYKDNAFGNIIDTLERGRRMREKYYEWAG